MREIGSEFWDQHVPSGEKCAENEKYLLSGRTALWFIIRDILKEKRVRKAMLPSYCCDSMVQPFLRAGLTVQFYDVSCDGICYPFDNDADVVLLVDFFGYVVRENREIAHREKQAGKTVIYDSTHKLNGNEKVELLADYSFCSYRKWFYCNYAKATKRQGSFGVREPLGIQERYVGFRDDGASEKRAYLSGQPGDKASFLGKFRAAEELLDEDYEGYAGKPVSFDIDGILAERRKNAAYIMQELKGMPAFKLWRDSVGPEDAPMFVPVLLEPSARDALRSFLISKGVYCPVHWPKTDLVQNVLCDMELSLICDQRYGISDMAYMITLIKDFFREDKR